MQWESILVTVRHIENDRFRENQLPKVHGSPTQSKNHVADAINVSRIAESQLPSKSVHDSSRVSEIRVKTEFSNISPISNFDRSHSSISHRFRVISMAPYARPHVLYTVTTTVYMHRTVKNEY
jgi:hypothetical protein